jgi:hypothetical protein
MKPTLNWRSVALHFMAAVEEGDDERLKMLASDTRLYRCRFPGRSEEVADTCLCPPHEEQHVQVSRSPVPCPVDGCFDGYDGTIFNAWDQADVDAHVPVCNAARLARREKEVKHGS